MLDTFTETTGTITDSLEVNAMVAFSLNNFDESFTVDREMNVGMGEVLNIKPKASDPSTAVEGDIYYNSTTHKLKVYNGTAWIDLH